MALPLIAHHPIIALIFFALMTTWLLAMSPPKDEPIPPNKPAAKPKRRAEYSGPEAIDHRRYRF